MGLTYGFQPTTGQFGPVITFDSDSDEPESYDYRFETDDGVIINVNVETNNESRAESVRLEIGEKLGWKGKPLEDEEESELTWSSATTGVGVFFEGLFWGVLAGAVLGVMTLFGFIFGDIMGLFDMDDWRVGFICTWVGFIFGISIMIGNWADGVSRLKQNQDPAKDVISR